jgi:hypothetical protein
VHPTAWLLAFRAGPGESVKQLNNVVGQVVSPRPHLVANRVRESLLDGFLQAGVLARRIRQRSQATSKMLPVNSRRPIVFSMVTPTSLSSPATTSAACCQVAIHTILSNGCIRSQISATPATASRRSFVGSSTAGLVGVGVGSDGSSNSGTP